MSAIAPYVLLGYLRFKSPISENVAADNRFHETFVETNLGARMLPVRSARDSFSGGPLRVYVQRERLSEPSENAFREMNVLSVIAKAP